MGHISEDELQKRLEDAQKKIKIGDVYAHYKHPDKHYKIETLGFLEATDGVIVGYRWLYGGEFLFFRPIDNFLEDVEVDGEMTPRFKKV